MYTASTKRRVLAHLIDEAIQFIIYIPLVIKIGTHWLDMGSFIVVPWIWIFALLCVSILYQVLCLYFLESLPGQWLLGLRVVSSYHPEMGLGWSQCFIHAFGDKLKLFLGNGLYYTGFLNRERRHLINLLAETRVVQGNNSQGLSPNRKFLAIVLFVLSLISTSISNIKLIQEVQFDSKQIQLPKSIITK